MALVKFATAKYSTFVPFADKDQNTLYFVSNGDKISLFKGEERIGSDLISTRLVTNAANPAVKKLEIKYVDATGVTVTESIDITDTAEVQKEIETLQASLDAATAEIGLKEGAPAADGSKTYTYEGQGYAEGDTLVDGVNKLAGTTKEVVDAVGLEADGSYAEMTASTHANVAAADTLKGAVEAVDAAVKGFQDVVGATADNKITIDGNYTNTVDNPTLVGNVIALDEAVADIEAQVAKNMGEGYQKAAGKVGDYKNASKWSTSDIAGILFEIANTYGLTSYADFAACDTLEKFDEALIKNVVRIDKKIADMTGIKGNEYVAREAVMVGDVDKSNISGSDSIQGALVDLDDALMEVQRNLGGTQIKRYETDADIAAIVTDGTAANVREVYRLEDVDGNAKPGDYIKIYKDMSVHCSFVSTADYTIYDGTTYKNEGDSIPMSSLGEIVNGKPTAWQQNPGRVDEFGQQEVLVIFYKLADGTVNFVRISLESWLQENEVGNGLEVPVNSHIVNVKIDAASEAVRVADATSGLATSAKVLSVSADGVAVAHIQEAIDFEGKKLADIIGVTRGADVDSFVATTHYGTGANTLMDNIQKLDDQLFSVSETYVKVDGITVNGRTTVVDAADKNACAVEIDGSVIKTGDINAAAANLNAEKRYGKVTNDATLKEVVGGTYLSTDMALVDALRTLEARVLDNEAALSWFSLD